MHPEGPLPPRVYWTRRLLIVAVVLVVVGIVWWVAPGVSGPSDASANPNPGPTSNSGETTTPHGPGAGSTTPLHPGPTQPKATKHTGGPAPPAHTGRTDGGGGSSPHRPVPRHRPEPTGPCDPTTLKLEVVVDDAPTGEGTTVGLRMSTGDGSTCSLGITPRVLETRITSVPVVVWQSSNCPDALPAENVVVRPRPTLVYSFDWDGRVTLDSCTSSDQIAEPGGYWAEAALIGGEPQKAFFEVTARPGQT